MNDATAFAMQLFADGRFADDEAHGPTDMPWFRNAACGVGRVTIAMPGPRRLPRRVVVRRAELTPPRLCGIL